MIENTLVLSSKPLQLFLKLKDYVFDNLKEEEHLFSELQQTYNLDCYESAIFIVLSAFWEDSPYILEPDLYNYFSCSSSKELLDKSVNSLFKKKLIKTEFLCSETGDIFLERANLFD